MGTSKTFRVGFAAILVLNGSSAIADVRLPRSSAVQEAQPIYTVDPATGLPAALTFTGSVTASTEYTEDAPAPANPVGGVLICVRRDTLSTSEVSADGDNISLKCTSKGEAAVSDATLQGAITTLNGKIDALNGKIDTLNGYAGDITTPQPISGTITANIGTVGTLATAAKQATLDSAGAQIVPKAGTADRVVTKTSLSANTSTSICPTATSPVTTEIWVETGAVGISLAGGSLSTAAWGATASTNPDIVIPSTAPYLLLPVAATNAITGRSATAQGVTCIQTLRQ